MIKRMKLTVLTALTLALLPAVALGQSVVAPPTGTNLPPGTLTFDPDDTAILDGLERVVRGPVAAGIRRPGGGPRSRRRRHLQTGQRSRCGSYCPRAGSRAFRHRPAR